MLHMAGSPDTRAAYRACYRQIRMLRRQEDGVPSLPRYALRQKALPSNLPEALRWQVLLAASKTLDASDTCVPIAGGILRLMNLRRAWADLEAPKKALSRAISITVNELTRKEVLAHSRDQELIAHLVVQARLVQARIRSSQKRASGWRARAAGNSRRAGNG